MFALESESFFYLLAAASAIRPDDKISHGRGLVSHEQPGIDSRLAIPEKLLVR